MADGAFAKAYSHVQNVEGFVSGHIGSATDMTNTLRSAALVAIQGITSGGLDAGVSIGSTPGGTAPVGEGSSGSESGKRDITFTVNVPRANMPDFGDISTDISEIDIGQKVTPFTLDRAPVFSGKIAGVTIPPPPLPTYGNVLPSKPNIPGVTIPDAPNVVVPDLPTLDELTIPEFNFPVIPAFDLTAPEFEGTPIQSALQWDEPEYQTEVIDEVIAVLRRIWAGELGLPAAVEQAMFERAAGREDLAVARAVSEVDVEFSSRGFTMPPGMHAARVDAIRSDAMVKQLALNRELTIQIAQWQIENMRFACEQGIAAENVLFNIFNNMVNRMFEAAKVQLAFYLDVYNAQVALFNARMSAYQTEAQVYETRLKAELSKIEVFKAEVEGEIARGQLNEQRVKVFSAVVDAMKMHIEIYKAKMEGAQVQSDVSRNLVEVYKAEVGAFAEVIRADKNRFDAYDSQMKGVAAQLGVMDAEAKVFASQVQAFSAVASAKGTQANAEASVIAAQVGMQRAKLEADKAKIDGELAAMEKSLKGYMATFEVTKMEMMAQIEEAKVSVQALLSDERVAIAKYEADTRADIAKKELKLSEEKLKFEKANSVAQITSQMVAGAMAGINVSASLQGGGSVTASGSEGYNENHNYSY